MDRPLWQIILSIMVLSFAMRLAVSGIALHAHTGLTLMIVAYVVQGIAGIALWASMLWSQRALRWAVLSYGASIATASALEAFVFRVQPVSSAVVQIAFALVASAIAAYALPRATALGNGGA
jgi:hypothetical protein